MDLTVADMGRGATRTPAVPGPYGNRGSLWPSSSPAPSMSEALVAAAGARLAFGKVGLGGYLPRISRECPSMPVCGECALKTCSRAKETQEDL